MRFEGGEKETVKEGVETEGEIEEGGKGVVEDKE